jgi:hypothetical protein
LAPTTTSVETAILETMGELERWRRRQNDLEAELQKAGRQVAYYEALLKDMKRDVQPPRLVDLFRAIAAR